MFKQKLFLEFYSISSLNKKVNVVYWPESCFLLCDYKDCGLSDDSPTSPFIHSPGLKLTNSSLPSHSMGVVSPGLMQNLNSRQVKNLILRKIPVASWLKCNLCINCLIMLLIACFFKHCTVCVSSFNITCNLRYIKKGFSQFSLIHRWMECLAVMEQHNPGLLLLKH